MLFIDDLLMLPFTGFKSILRTLVKVAEEQYTDDAPIKERLLQLQVDVDEGKINEDEYVEQEAQILRELREIQNRKREMAGLPPEEATGLSGKVKEGSGVELLWDPNSDDNVGPGR
ncbi:MAG: gas vesicle protein GvpG [Acidobacteria bacterium]|nr:gas vesicle protein GvpG [Acidobacteriota bacterium]MBV9148160.1 gas vesicle protein GvpG [Acidobacteriota bacterium]MBV9436437.1 gas vesicle protein GvpG [Acidobacteriota bacterium]